MASDTVSASGSRGFSQQQRGSRGGTAGIKLAWGHRHHASKDPEPPPNLNPQPADEGKWRWSAGDGRSL